MPNNPYERGGGGGGGVYLPRSNDPMSQAGSRLQAVDWGRVNAPPIVKEIYNEHPQVTGRPVEEITQWLKKNQLMLHGDNIPRPVFEFDETTFPGKSASALVPLASLDGASPPSSIFRADCEAAL
jgi:hypothetical protein